MTHDKIVRDPVYKQLNDALRRLIVGGEFRRGEKFLSEREIGERFSVSRATANKALSTLVAEGVLAFRKGVGTFVDGTGRSIDQRLARSFDDGVLAAGQTPSRRVLSARRLTGAELEPAIAASLSLGATDEAFYVERLRLADGEPLVLERRTIAQRACPDLLDADLAGSLRLLWRERYALEFGAVKQTIRAVACSGSDADKLEITAGTPCLRVHALVRLADGAPLYWERALYRGDASDFHAPLLECNLLARRASRPARLRAG